VGESQELWKTTPTRQIGKLVRADHHCDWCAPLLLQLYESLKSGGRSEGGAHRPSDLARINSQIAGEGVFKKEFKHANTMVCFSDLSFKWRHSAGEKHDFGNAWVFK
jgi:hypothetical protein